MITVSHTVISGLMEIICTRWTTLNAINVNVAEYRFYKTDDWGTPPILRMRESGGSLFAEASYNGGKSYVTHDSQTLANALGTATPTAPKFGVGHYVDGTNTFTPECVLTGLQYVGN